MDASAARAADTSLQQVLPLPRPRAARLLVSVLWCLCKAGAGGADAMDWAGMLERMYQRWAERSGHRISLLDRVEGAQPTCPPVMALRVHYQFQHRPERFKCSSLPWLGGTVCIRLISCFGMAEHALPHLMHDSCARHSSLALTATTSSLLAGHCSELQSAIELLLTPCFNRLCMAIRGGRGREVSGDADRGPVCVRLPGRGEGNAPHCAHLPVLRQG